MRTLPYVIAASLAALGCESSTTISPDLGDAFVLTAAQKQSLDSTGGVIVAANPGDATLQSLVDSTLEVLSVGIEARRLNVVTNFTTKPLYFVAIHRARAAASGSWSTWTVVGFDDPSHLTVLVEIGGFDENNSSVPPANLSAAIGSGLVNGRMLEVAQGGAVTMYTAESGTASFESGAPGSACPNFTNTATVACVLEELTTHFDMTAGGKSATLSSASGVAGMRLDFTP